MFSKLFVVPRMSVSSNCVPEDSIMVQISRKVRKDKTVQFMVQVFVPASAPIKLSETLGKGAKAWGQLLSRAFQHSRHGRLTRVVR